MKLITLRLVLFCLVCAVVSSVFIGLITSDSGLGIRFFFAMIVIYVGLLALLEWETRKIYRKAGRARE